MPGLGRTDPADLTAHARAQLGLRRQLQQAERVPPHPSRGGCGYPVFHRDQQLALWQAGERPHSTHNNKQPIRNDTHRKLPKRCSMYFKKRRDHLVPVLSRRTDEGPFGPRTKKEKSDTT